jgi:hypothetical protein
MPGNPKKCRAHALRCDKLARAATTPDARQHFLGLSETWKRLAAEFEAGQAFLDAMEAMEPPSQPIRLRRSA